MMGGKEFIELVDSYFRFLTIDFGFVKQPDVIKESVFYLARFKNRSMAVSISYENLEDFFSAVVYLLENGQLPEVNDDARRLPLKKIRRTIHSSATSQNRKLNDEWFANFVAIGTVEREILNAAKDFRMFLMLSDLAK